MPWTHPLRGRLRPPGDKSITHRAILLAALVAGQHQIEGWLDAEDTRSSLRLVTALGVSVVEATTERLILESPGREGWHDPSIPVDCGNSGTTMRLGMGLVTGLREGLTVLWGDSSLSRRPMARVAEPLRQLGATVLTRSSGTAPVAVAGGPLEGGTVELAVASAQVKSAVLLAGLWAKSPVAVVEPLPTRDHTERMLAALGAPVDRPRPGWVMVAGPPERPLDFRVPGDPSSGAFWAALAALLPGSHLELEGVSLNPGRLGFYRALADMGVPVTYTIVQDEPEPLGRITVSSHRLTPLALKPEAVPEVIDELPLLALLATQAHGTSTIRGAAELRVKESDRIRTTAELLTALGGAVEEHPDGWVIYGPTPLSGGRVQAHGDHRVAMTAAVAAAVARQPVWLEGAEAVAISYPEFFATYDRLAQGIGVE